jgi:hypothetical protein
VEWTSEQALINDIATFERTQYVRCAHASSWVQVVLHSTDVVEIRVAIAVIGIYLVPTVLNRLAHMDVSGGSEL